jgi:UDP-N-acetylglucosamine transferase subunit ALG13
MLNVRDIFPGVDRPKLLLLASTGGHLEQLSRIFPVNAVHPDSLWVTFTSAQTTSLMVGRRCGLIQEIGNRDYRGVPRGIFEILNTVADEHFDAAVSTGAAIALSGFAAARIKKIPTLYIESVSRVKGPSMTGRIVSRTRLADRLATQYETYADGRWRYYGSVMDAFCAEPVSTRSGPVLVTLGTLTKYQFPRLISYLHRLLGDDPDVVWQLGSNPDPGLPGQVYQTVSSQEFDHFAREARCVISHAGVGSALRLMELGIFPILAVRRQAYGEHVDDHQQQIADLLAQNSLCLRREADQIRSEDIVKAASMAVRVRAL